MFSLVILSYLYLCTMFIQYKLSQGSALLYDSSYLLTYFYIQQLHLHDIISSDWILFLSLSFNFLEVGWACFMSKFIVLWNLYILLKLYGFPLLNLLPFYVVF